MKKKKLLIILLFVFASSSKLFALNISLGASFDLSSIWVRPVNVSGDLRVDILDNLRVRVPLSFYKGTYNNLFTISAVVDYSPFDRYTGMFFGFALAELGLLYKGGGNMRMLFMNELQVGFRQSAFNNYVFFESILSLRDPFFAFNQQYKEINSSIPSYTKVKFMLNVGVNFDLFKKKTMKKTTTTKKKT